MCIPFIDWQSCTLLATSVIKVKFVFQQQSDTDTLAGQGGQGGETPRLRLLWNDLQDDANGQMGFPECDVFGAVRAMPIPDF